MPKLPRQRNEEAAGRLVIRVEGPDMVPVTYGEVAGKSGKRRGKRVRFKSLDAAREYARARGLGITVVFG